jgi:hypothetical protein
MHTRPNTTTTWKRVRRNPAVERSRVFDEGATTSSRPPNNNPRRCVGPRRDRVVRARRDVEAFVDLDVEPGLRDAAADFDFEVERLSDEAAPDRFEGSTLRRDLATSVPRFERRSLVMADHRSRP